MHASACGVTLRSLPLSIPIADMFMLYSLARSSSCTVTFVTAAGWCMFGCARVFYQSVSKGGTCNCVQLGPTPGHCQYHGAAGVVLVEAQRTPDASHSWWTLSIDVHDRISSTLFSSRL